MSRHQYDLIQCMKQPGKSIGLLCSNCDGNVRYVIHLLNLLNKLEYVKIVLKVIFLINVYYVLII